MTELRALTGGTGAAAAASCTTESCRQVVKGVKALYAKLLGEQLSCKYTCKWFYSQGGGWQKECYFRCSGKGVTMEGTGSL